MKRLSARLCVIVFACLFATSHAVTQDLPLPKEWQTLYVCFLGANLNYTAGTAEAETALTMAHMQYQLRLEADGKAIAAGGIGRGTGVDLVVGMTLLRASSMEEALTWANDDPAVRAGRLQVFIREWRIPADRLPQLLTE